MELNFIYTLNKNFINHMKYILLVKINYGQIC